MSFAVHDNSAQLRKYSVIILICKMNHDIRNIGI